MDVFCNNPLMSFLTPICQPAPSADHLRWHSRDTKLIGGPEQTHQEAHVSLLRLWQSQLSGVDEPQTLRPCWGWKGWARTWIKTIQASSRFEIHIPRFREKAVPISVCNSMGMRSSSFSFSMKAWFSPTLVPLEQIGISRRSPVTAESAESEKLQQGIEGVIGNVLDDNVRFKGLAHSASKGPTWSLTMREIILSCQPHFRRTRTWDTLAFHLVQT